MPKRAVNSMAWEVLTMAPRMSGRLRRIPPMCESLKSIPLRGVCENSDSTSSSGKSDGSQLAVVEVAVAQIAGGELRLIDFTHGKIEVSGIAVLHCQMVQYCFRQIGSHQFAGYEFHSEQRTFGK